MVTVICPQGDSRPKLLPMPGVQRLQPDWKSGCEAPIGATVARRVSGAQLVEVDSDHYLTLREPDRITRILEQFLVEAARHH
jgi:hypothetical protein